MECHFFIRADAGPTRKSKGAENETFEIYDKISYCKYTCRDFNKRGLLTSLKRGINNILKERKDLGYD